MPLDTQTLARLSIMVLIPVVLSIIPFKFDRYALMRLAFAIWMTGGILLSKRGIDFLTQVDQPFNVLALSILGALLVGMLKGKFVLNKSSIRNIIRLEALSESKKAIHVYPMRSWIVIGLMLLISLSLTVFNVDIFIRGLVNIAVGMGLITSSFIYLKHLRSPFTPATTSETPANAEVQGDSNEAP